MSTVESMDEARQLLERATLHPNVKVQSKLLTRLKHVQRDAGMFIVTYIRLVRKNTKEGKEGRVKSDIIEALKKIV